MKWHAIQGFNLGPRFFRQNTTGDALGVLTPKASPSGWVFRQAQYPMIKIYNKLPIDIFLARGGFETRTFTRCEYVYCTHTVSQEAHWGTRASTKSKVRIEVPIW